MSLVSIIIPCYNAAEFIAQAIHSCLQQSHPEIEIIVIDDGSQDQTVQEVLKFGDRVRLIQQSNRGVSIARNRGLEQAQGEYVQFLDADDLLSQEKISKQLACALATQTEIILCQMWDLDEATGTLSKSPCFYQDHAFDLDPFTYFSRHYVQTGNPLLKKSKAQEVGGFREMLKRGEERDLLLRMVAAGGKVSLADEYLYTIRHHNSPHRSNQSHLAIREHGKSSVEALEHRLMGQMSLIEVLKASPELYPLSEEHWKLLGEGVFAFSIYNWRDGDPASAKRGFDFLKKHHLHRHAYPVERPWYHVIARCLGHAKTESLLACARKFKRLVSLR